MNKVKARKILFIMSSIKRAKKAEEALNKIDEPVEFFHATRSAEAIAKCEDASFDIILCDYYMPNLTGLDILKRIRKQDPERPFVMMIDYQSQGIIVDIIKAGADDYIIVDIAFEDILPLVVQKVLKFYKMKNKYQVLEKKLKTSQGDATILNMRDDITNLRNRRDIVKKLDEENARAKRYDRPLSVLLLDIDDFSMINREYGHDMGNFVLQKIAAMMKKILRQVDAVGRYSGDEFLVLLPETPIEKASIVAGKLLENIGKHVFNSKGVQFKATLSIGISWAPRFGIKNYEELLSSAAKALFRAKNEGGGRLKIAGKYR